MSRMNTLYGWSTSETRDGADTRKKDLAIAVERCTELDGQSAALRFVPHSVTQRKRGLVLHNWKQGKRWVRQWITPAQRDMLIWREQKAKLRKEVQSCIADSFDWFKVVQQEEDLADAKYVEMSSEDWESWKNADIQKWVTRSQRFNGLIFWDRIDRKRKIQSGLGEKISSPGWTIEQDMEDEPWKYDESVDMEWETLTMVAEDMDWEYLNQW